MGDIFKSLAQLQLKIRLLCLALISNHLCLQVAKQAC